jgi:hypothetical protein
MNLKKVAMKKKGKKMVVLLCSVAKSSAWKKSVG